MHRNTVRGLWGVTLPTLHEPGRADLPVGLDARQRVPTLEPIIVITGSLYLVGEALELLGFSPATGSERMLNEWRAEPVFERT